MENLEKGKENCSFEVPYAKLINKTTCEPFCLKKDVEIIGRSSSALVTLRDLDVSRTHCLLSKESDGLCALLPQGLSDTLVNGEICPRNKKIILKTGDEIGISRHHFTFKYMELPLQKPMDITCIMEDDTIEKRRSLFELTQNEEREVFNKSYIQLRNERDQIVRDLSALKLEQFSNNNGNSKEEKDVCIRVLEEKLKTFKKKEDEWLKDKEELEKRLDNQKKEYEEQLKTKKSQEKKLTGLKRTNKHLQVEFELCQKIKNELEKENDELKEELDLKKKRVFNMMESVECGICSELCVEPVLLNCGHTFCKFCMSTWKKKKKECPMCRTKIKTELRNFCSDSLIEKLVQCLPEEEQKERENLVKIRKGESSRASSSAKASVEETISNPTNVMHTSSRPPRTRRRVLHVPREVITIQDPFYWVEPATVNLEEPDQGTSAHNSSIIVEQEIDLTNVPALTHVNTSPSTNVSTSVIDLTTSFLN